MKNNVRLDNIFSRVIGRVTVPHALMVEASNPECSFYEEVTKSKNLEMDEGGGE